MIEYRRHNFTHVANWTEDEALLRAAVAEWNRLQPRPKFIVITGDLANAFPRNYSTLRRQQLDAVRAELSAVASDIPLVLLSGNHDLEDQPTGETTAAYVAEFGDDYFTFWIDGVRFIVLNSQLYRDHEAAIEDYEAQEKWLNETLAEPANATHSIVFQHIPWFLSNISEPFDPVVSLVGP